MVREIEEKSRGIKRFWGLIFVLQTSLIFANLMAYYILEEVYFQEIKTVLGANGGALGLIFLIYLFVSAKQLGIYGALKNEQKCMVYSRKKFDGEVMEQLVATRRRLLGTIFLNCLLLAFAVPAVGLVLESKFLEQLKKLENSKFKKDREFEELFGRKFRALI